MEHRGCRKIKVSSAERYQRSFSVCTTGVKGKKIRVCLKGEVPLFECSCSGSFNFVFRPLVRACPRWGTVNAKVEVPSVDTTHTSQRFHLFSVLKEKPNQMNTQGPVLRI